MPSARSTGTQAPPRLDVRRVAHGVPQALGWIAFWSAFTLLGLPWAAAIEGEDGLVLHKALDALGGRYACVAIGLALLAVSVVLLRLAQRRRQGLEDRRAAEIMAALRDDPQAELPPFLLYLRAFETTGRLAVPLFVRLRRAGLAMVRGVTDDLESYIGAAVRGSAPLIALGRPGESVGAGRIATADAHWQVDIDLLIRRAQGILLVPSDRAGTRWEIEKLRLEGRLPRVIFVMPPVARGTYDSAAGWEAARTALAPLGLQLPPYDPRGLLFELTADGRFLQAEPLLPHAPRAMRRSVARLLDPAVPAGSVEASLKRARSAARRATFWGWAETGRQLAPYVLALASPLAPPPPAAFDPHDSWSVVLDRSTSGLSLELTRALVAPRVPLDEAVAGWRAAAEGRADPRPALAAIGLPLVDAATQEAWRAGRAQMLARMGERRCAAAVRGSLDTDLAHGYLPGSHGPGFIAAETAAILAGLEALASGPAGERAATPAASLQRLRAALPPAEHDRLDRALAARDASGEPGDAALCGLWRRMLASDANLPDAALAALLEEDSRRARAALPPAFAADAEAIVRRIAANEPTLEIQPLR